MPSYDIRILTGSYSKEAGDTVVVDLYGKTRDGKTVVARKPHRPWFQVIEPSPQCIRYLKEHDEVVSIKECTLWYDGRDRPAVHATAKHPWKVGGDAGMRAELETKFKATVVACDIPFHLRFIYDYDLPACVRVSGSPVTEPRARARFSADIVLNATDFEEVEPFDVPLRIMSYDIENSIKNKTIYCIACALRDGDKEIEYTMLSGPERDIIRDWIVYIKTHDVDIITGYNTSRYDLPWIIDRAGAHGIGPESIKIGRDGSPPSLHGEGQWKLHGRIMADSWWAVRTELRPKQETLNYVSQKVLGEKKEDVDSKRIDEEWAADKNKVMSYCRKDAELALRLLEVTRVVQKALDLSVVARLPFAEAFDARTSALIDSSMIRTTDRRNIAVPPTRSDKDAGNKEKIEGGYVKLPKAGLYNIPILCIDVRSMYPSQIIKNNICFTTLDPNGANRSPHDPNVRYLSSDIKQGILPALLAKWWADRDTAKKKMKEAKAAGNKADVKYYNGLQGAIKILMNASYGVFASSFYRFTNKDIGASITAFSREAIKGAAEKLEKEGLSVIYSDTDSLFIQSPSKSLTETVRIGQDIAERYTEGQVAFDFEKVLCPWFTHGAKKRYFGRIVWPPVNASLETMENDRIRLWSPKNEAAVKSIQTVQGAEWVEREGYWSFPGDRLDEVRRITTKYYPPEDDMLVRGYETRRTDSFDRQERALTTLFQKILARDIPGAIKHAISEVQTMLRGEVPYPDIVISRSVKEDDEKCPRCDGNGCTVCNGAGRKQGSYKHADRMVNVLVSRKIKAMGEMFTPGMKVSWIVTNANVTPQEAEPYLSGRLFRHTPDWQYYARRLAKSLARVTELWDWDTEALLTGTKQSRLFGEPGHKPAKKKRKKKTKAVAKHGAFF